MHAHTLAMAPLILTLLGACTVEESPCDGEYTFAIRAPELLDRPILHAPGTWGPWLAWRTEVGDTAHLQFTSLACGRPRETALVSRMEPAASVDLSSVDGEALLAWMPQDTDHEGRRSVRWLTSSRGETPPARTIPLNTWASEPDRYLQTARWVDGVPWVLVTGDDTSQLVHPFLSTILALEATADAVWTVEADHNGIFVRSLYSQENRHWRLDPAPSQVTGLWRWGDRTWVALIAGGEPWLLRDDLDEPMPLALAPFHHQCAAGPNGLLCAVAQGTTSPYDIVLQDFSDDTDPLDPPTEHLGRGRVPSLSRQSDDRVLVTWKTDAGIEGDLLHR